MFANNRRSHARRTCTIVATIQREGALSMPANASGIIRDGSPTGACLHLDFPLNLGEWVYLQVAANSDIAVQPQQIVKARVVRKLSVAEVNGRPGSTPVHIFGLSFVPHGKRRGVFEKYAPFTKRSLAQWGIGALFVAGIANVAYLKSFNIEYFWYQPLLNFYSIIISCYILSRFFLSAFYRAPKDVGFQPSVTVIIACKNEEDSIGKTIDCIYQSMYPRDRFEVISVNDGSTDRTLAEMYAAQARHSGLRVIDFEKNRGKRHGMAAGARVATGDILVCIDSDSFVQPNTIHKLVQGFADREVGAVCGHANVQNAAKNALTKMQEVRYFVAFRVVKAAESLFSAVACCSGCLAAYRREYVMPILDHWLNQKFLGEEATFGDDRSLTNYMLRRYRVIYDAEAVCKTIVPEKYSVFFRQQLRWKKSWIRESLIGSSFMWRKHPVAAFFYYLGVLFPLIAPVIVFLALVLPVFGGGAVSYLYIYGAVLMSLLYSLVYLAHFRNGLWLYGVLFSFFYMLVLVWQTYYAIVTVRRNHWGTR